MAKAWKEKKRKYKIRKDAKFTNISAIPVIRSLVALGCTQEDIGIILDVGGGTINQWKVRYPDIFKANEEGRKLLKGRVFAEMIRAATGYNYTEKDVKYAVIIDADGTEQVDTSRKVVTEHEKYQPGSPALLQFIAQNILPEQFPRVPITIESNTIQLITNVEESRIRDFCGKLMELRTKTIESKEVIEEQKCQEKILNQEKNMDENTTIEVKNNGDDGIIEITTKSNLKNTDELRP